MDPGVSIMDLRTDITMDRIHLTPILGPPGFPGAHGDADAVDADEGEGDADEGEDAADVDEEEDVDLTAWAKEPATPTVPPTRKI
jgi:hypothetical protein